ncbi:hypothetical protein ACLB1M_24600 [Escherichia coli]
MATINVLLEQRLPAQAEQKGDMLLGRFPSTGAGISRSGTGSAW